MLTSQSWTVRDSEGAIGLSGACPSVLLNSNLIVVSVLEVQTFRGNIVSLFLCPQCYGKTILAVGMVVTWTAGCLIGNGQPGPFEVVLRPIW